MTTPITVSELSERGMDDRLMEIVHGLIGEHLRSPMWLTLSVKERRALGYDPPSCSACDCGEACKGCCDPGDCDCRKRK